MSDFGIRAGHLYQHQLLDLSKHWVWLPCPGRMSTAEGFQVQVWDRLTRPHHTSKTISGSH